MNKNKTAKPVTFLSQYIKDLSFENYAAQSLQLNNEKLDYNIDLNIKRKYVATEILEVTLLLLLEASFEKHKKFILELTYAATFSFDSQKNKEEQKRLAFIDCPTMMFPYLRQIVFNISRDSGYPPVNLDHINFKDIFYNMKKININ